MTVRLKRTMWMIEARDDAEQMCMRKNAKGIV